MPTRPTARSTILTQLDWTTDVLHISTTSMAGAAGGITAMFLPTLLRRVHRVNIGKPAGDVRMTGNLLSHHNRHRPHRPLRLLHSLRSHRSHRDRQSYLQTHTRLPSRRNARR